MPVNDVLGVTDVHGLAVVAHELVDSSVGMCGRQRGNHHTSVAILDAFEQSHRQRAEISSDGIVRDNLGLGWVTGFAGSSFVDQIALC